MAKIGRTITPVVKSFSDAIRGFYKTYEKEIKSVGEAIAEFGQQLYIYREFQTKCRAHNLVPHKYLFSIIQQEPTYFLVSEAEQLRLLKNNWENIRDKLLSETAMSGTDELRNKLFQELVAAHENGLYMIVVRAAIVEVEGLASEYCQKNEIRNNVNARKKVINGWRAKLQSTEMSIAEGYFIILSFENYIHNVFKNSNASFHEVDLTETDKLMSRHFHAHGNVAHVSEKQSLNALLFLHNISSYFIHLSKISNPKIRN